MLPPAIIDTHQHLWNLSQFELGWLKEEPFCQLHRDHTLEDYSRDTAELNITQSIYMEVDVLESQQPREAQWILDLCQQPNNCVAAAVISGRPRYRRIRRICRAIPKVALPQGRARQPLWKAAGLLQPEGLCG